MSDAAVLLPLLRDVADRAIAEGKNLRLLREKGPQSSGVAVLKGKIVVVLEPGIPQDEEARLLVEGLRRLDLSGFFLPPAVRDALDAGTP
ncbi:MAG TPA: hypothetical protein VMV18_08860 [bacterium]|nr:hypothetical protein [bacterium]